MFLQSVGIKLLRGEETARVEPLLRGNDGVLVGGSISVPTGVVDFAAATCALLRDCQVIAGARVTGFHRRRPGGGGGGEGHAHSGHQHDGRVGQGV